MSEQEEKTQEYIVVAEDSPPNRAILVHLLKKLGYGVIEGNDGAEAWKKLEEAHGEGKKITCVISDIMMPNKDGISFLKDVRENEKYKELPFVLVTAVSDKEYIVQAKDLSVNGYILKPVTFQRVQTKLQELFPGKLFPKLAG